MKRTALLTLTLIHLVLSTSVEAATWTQKSNYGPGIRMNPIGFSINNIGYFGTGALGTSSANITAVFNDLWRYNEATDSWTQMASFTGSGRYNALAFVIGNYGYVGTGLGITWGTWLNDFYKYDPSANTWSAIAPLPAVGRYGSTGFGIGSNGYAGGGYNGGYLSDFYEYNSTGNTWVAKANIPSPRSASFYFSSGNKGYMGTGSSSGGFLSDFYEFDPSAGALGTWTAKTNFPGGNRAASFFASAFGKGYIGSGTNGSSYKNDFWCYDVASDVWSTQDSFPGLGRETLASFFVHGKIFTGGGGHNIGSWNSLGDVWEYDICNTTGLAQTGSDVTICKNDSAQLGVSAVSGHTYQWMPTTGLTAADISNPYAMPLATQPYTLTETVTATGCQASHSVHVTVKNCGDATGLFEENSNNPLSISPNPSNGIFTLSYISSNTENVKVKVYDVCGNMVRNTIATCVNGAVTQSIDLSNLPSGIYVIDFNSGTKHLHTKLALTK